MARKVGIGIIGAGIMGTRYGKACRDNEYAEVVAVADVDEGRAKKLAGELGAEPYRNSKSLLANKDVEAVFITTPDYLHKEPVIAAAKEKKHMWIEKPLATTMEDANEMMNAIEKAEQAGVKITVQYGTLWSPFYWGIACVARWGYMGDPVSCAFTINDRIDVPLSMWGGPSTTWAKNSTVADFLMCYAVNYAMKVTGRKPRSVYGISKSTVLKFTPDFFQGIVDFGDFSGYFESNWVVGRTKPPLSEHFLNLIYSKGTAQYTGSGTTFAAHSVGGAEIFFDETITMDTLLQIQKKLAAEGIVSRIVYEAERESPYQIWTVQDKNRGIWIPASLPHKVKHHQGSQLSNFMNCVLEDEDPYITAEDGYMAAKVVCAVKKAAEEGNIVKL